MTTGSEAPASSQDCTAGRMIDTCVGPPGPPGPPAAASQADWRMWHLRCLYVFMQLGSTAADLRGRAVDRKRISEVRSWRHIIVVMVCTSCRCHTVETTGVCSLSMATKQSSRSRAWESFPSVFILPTQRLLPALVFCSPWLASPPGIFGHRLFLEQAIFPPSGECEILGCVSDKARRRLSAGGREMNDQIARELPPSFLFFWVFVLVLSSV